MGAARVLLIGGSGLLGTPAARTLRNAGHDVTVVSRGRHGLVPGVRHVRADRAGGAAFAAPLRGERFDLVVDFLAYDGAAVEQVLALPALADARYALVSTGQVYLVANERRPPSREADGELPLMPEPPAGTRDHANWVYGRGKREAEASLRAHAAARGGRDVVLRLPVVQGAGDGTRRLWAYLERLRDGGPLLLPGGGLDPVRFVWAEDVARLLASLAGGLSPAGSVYNLAQPDEPPLRELLERAAAALGVAARFVSCDEADLAGEGLDLQVSPFSGAWCSRPDPSLAAAQLGFRGTPSTAWLPEVVRAHLAEDAPASHPGYAQRPRELVLAARLAESRGRGGPPA